jgi:hypothetical protein
MSDVDYLRGRTGFFSNIELVASSFTFPTHKFRLNRSSITLYILKHLRRGQTVTVQKWTVTVGQ